MHRSSIDPELAAFARRERTRALCIYANSQILQNVSAEHGRRPARRATDEALAQAIAASTGIADERLRQAIGRLGAAIKGT